MPFKEISFTLISPLLGVSLAPVLVAVTVGLFVVAVIPGIMSKGDLLVGNGNVGKALRMQLVDEPEGRVVASKVELIDVDSTAEDIGIRGIRFISVESIGIIGGPMMTRILLEEF